MEQPDIMRIKDLAAYLHVSKSTVQRYLKNGLLPYTKIGKIVYIKMQDVNAFLDSNQCES